MRDIISNPNTYVFDAIEAANGILEERKKHGIAIEKKKFSDELSKNEPSLTKPKKEKKKKLNLKKDFKDFFETYNLNTVLSHVSLSLLYATVSLLFNFYEGEDETVFSRFWSMTVLIPTLLLTNNFFYKKQISQAVSFYTRCINGIMFFFYYAFISGVINSFFYQTNYFTKLDFTDFTGAILAIGFVVFVIEVIVEGLLSLRSKVLGDYE